MTTRRRRMRGTVTSMGHNDDVVVADSDDVVNGRPRCERPTAQLEYDASICAVVDVNTRETL